jgi:hypothetical protein
VFNATFANVELAFLPSPGMATRQLITKFADLAPIDRPCVVPGVSSPLGRGSLVNGTVQIPTRSLG